MLRQLDNKLRKHWIILPILCIGIAFRGWEITKIGLRGDEAVYAGQALILAGNQEMRRFFVLASRGVSNFLLHQTLQAVMYLIFGVSDLSTRILSVAFSTLTILIVYILAQELFDKKIGAVSAFLLAINAYAISLGRLALLDSTMTFFFTLSLLWLTKWMRTLKPKWAYLLAGTIGLAITSKVPAAVLIPLSLLVVITTRSLPNLRVMAKSASVFTLAVSPAILQVSSNFSQLTAFFLSGTSRISSVKMTYYIDKMIAFAGPIFLIITFCGIALALVYRKRGDVLCLIWAVIVLGFFQIYPLKGFNYILPFIPVASILAGRGLVSLGKIVNHLPLSGIRGNSSRQRALTTVSIVLLLGPVACSLGYASLYNIIYDRPFVGLREAAYWLRDNVNLEEGVMTISQGSAQYVLSFYAKIDAYPFGNFSLYTVLPGDGLFPGAPPPDPFIQNGTVTYLVHYVSWGGDDPIHMPFKRPIEEKFIEFIQKYQGTLLHTIYYQFTGLDGVEIREARVWIYKVGTRLPEPEVEVNLENNTLDIKGAGFLIDSHVDVYYGDAFLGRFFTDDMGVFTVSINAPQLIDGAELVILDPNGNRFSTTFTIP